MSFLEINCPRCSSHRVERADATHYRCLHCQAFFMRDAPPAPAPMPPPPTAGVPVTSFVSAGMHGITQRQAGGGAHKVGVIIGLSIVGVVFTLVAMAALVANRKAKPPRPATVVTSQPVVTVPTFETTAKGPTPQARIKGKQKGVTLLGAPFWIFNYENTGQSPIGNAAVRVSLFDGSGHRLDEVTGYAVNKNLAPKKSTPILVLGKKLPGASKEEIVIQPPEAPSSYDASQLDMTVVEFTARKDNSLTDIVGTVKNPTSTKVRFIHVVAMGLDASGEAISYSDTFASSKELAPGGTSGFKITAGTFDITPPDRYQLFSVAMPLR